MKASFSHRSFPALLFPQAFGAWMALKYVIRNISLHDLTLYMQFTYNLSLGSDADLAVGRLP